MNIKIRRATLQDVSIISQIHAECWKTAYRGIMPQKYLDELKVDFWVPTFTNWIENGIFSVYLICVDEIPVGCTAYGKSRDDKLPDWGEVISVYIRSDYWGKGLAKKLLEYVLLCMRQDGYRNCYLWVLKENLRARHFYEKIRFEWNQDELFSDIMGKQIVDVRYVLKFE